MCQDKPLEAHHDGGGECNRVEVISTRCSRVFRHWHHRGGFKERGVSCLDQLQVEDVGRDLSQLSSTGPEHLSGDAIRASSLMCISHQ